MSLDLSNVYPPSPAVPPGLTEPSAAYKRHAWLALAGLLAFVAVYLGLTGYLGWAVYRLVRGGLSGNVGSFFLALGPGFFLAFLLRGLFVIKHAKDESLVELQRADEPTLFAFLDRLADETKAPRPHRVFVSGRVNAAVFYDLSFWNLLFPSKKNLELGLGLLNNLTLDEFKAVLAHEYGHFAQRTMAVGRWVYVAQQIAGHLVMSRGAFDKVLLQLSATDFRIAWIGWVLRLFVWAIRAVLDTVFRVVVIAHRALGREMEFQADRVSASVAGSDSLVHALHRISASDQAWEEAANFVFAEARAGRPVEDLFAWQTLALGHFRRVLGEPEFGLTPKRGDGAGHRVFDQKLAQPPRMWLTHPPSREREDAVKTVYVPSPLDAREAWVLFRDAAGLRRRVTAAMFAKVERMADPPPVTEPAEQRFARQYERAALDPSYHGAYLGRSIAAYDEAPQAMLGTSTLAAPDDVLGALARLYPASLRGDLSSYRERREEEALLQGLADGRLDAPGGVIRHRGREHRRRELPRLLEAVRTERKELEARLLAHDRSVRATHLAAAQLVGNGWPEHLEGLVKLLHFATHTLRAVTDAHEYLHHVLAIVFADNHVSSSERKRVLDAAADFQQVLAAAWVGKRQLTLPPDVAARFQQEGGWSALDEDLGLPPPTNEKLGDWLQACDGWGRAGANDFSTLCEATLDTLLEVEGKLARLVRTGEPAEAAPTPARVPSDYPRCCIGDERQRQKKLDWWDRFQTADGLVPGTLRVAVASAVLLPALFVGGHVGEARLHVVNGLGQTVTVSVGGVERVITPHAIGRLELEPTSNAMEVTARTADGQLIERFEVEGSVPFAHLVYNVAQAAPLVEWTAVYGTYQPVPDRPLGAPRWLTARQNHVFEKPPKSISTKGSGGSLTVLEAVLGGVEGLQFIKSDAERAALVLAHLRFDSPRDPQFLAWLGEAEAVPDARAALVARADASPTVALERAVQDVVDDDEKARRCTKTKAAAAARPDDGDLQYLAVRCGEEGAAREAAFLAAWEQHPKNAWLNWAVADTLAARGRWKDAAAAWDAALSPPDMAALRDAGALEALRTLRVAETKGEKLPRSRWLTSASPNSLVAFINHLEGAPVLDEPPAVTLSRALSKGRLADVRKLIESGKLEAQLREHAILLLACSDGGDEDLGAPALRQKPRGGSAWMQAALAARRGESPAKWLEAPGLPVDGALLEPLLEPATLARHPEALTALFEGQPLRARAQLAAMGVMVLGRRAPGEWRSLAKAGLFAYERPWFE